jgi:hypothetical protein
VPADFALSDANIRETGRVLPNRKIGGVRGVDTSVPREVALAAGHTMAPATPTTRPLADASREGYLGCHGIDRKVVGPALRPDASVRLECFVAFERSPGR